VVVSAVWKETLHDRRNSNWCDSPKQQEGGNCSPGLLHFKSTTCRDGIHQDPVVE
jgi:hypothetical protein